MSIFRSYLHLLSHILQCVSQKAILLVSAQSGLDVIKFENLWHRGLVNKSLFLNCLDYYITTITKWARAPWSWMYRIIYLSCFCQFLTFSAMVNNLDISINLETLLGIEGKEQTLESEKQFTFWIFYCMALAQPITVPVFQFCHLKNGDSVIYVESTGVFKSNVK